MDAAVENDRAPERDVQFSPSAILANKRRLAINRPSVSSRQSINDHGGDLDDCDAGAVAAVDLSGDTGDGNS